MMWLNGRWTDLPWEREAVTRARQQQLERDAEQLRGVLASEDDRHVTEALGGRPLVTVNVADWFSS